MSFSAGDRVIVESGGTSYEATVVEVKGGYFKVHYKGFNSRTDEWVPKGRISAFSAKALKAGSKKRSGGATKAAAKSPKKSRTGASPKKGSLYKTIKGNKYDRGMLDAADAAVAGEHDNVISIPEAKVILRETLDGGKYTATEKATMAYIRKNYKFTPQADAFVRHAVASFASKQGAKTKSFAEEQKSKKSGLAVYKKIAGVKYDKGMLEAAEKGVEGTGDGRISIDDAKLILDETLDGDRYTVVEKRTMKYIRDNFKFTPAADKYTRSQITRWAAKKSAK